MSEKQACNHRMFINSSCNSSVPSPPMQALFADSILASLLRRLPPFTGRRSRRLPASYLTPSPGAARGAEMTSALPKPLLASHRFPTVCTRSSLFMKNENHGEIFSRKPQNRPPATFAEAVAHRYVYHSAWQKTRPLSAAHPAISCGMHPMSRIQ